MPKFDLAPAQGYVFDGLMFVRASVNNKDLLVNAESRQFLGIDPDTAVWYTRREFQNAIAACQQKKTIPMSVDLNFVAPVPALLKQLEKSSLRKTQDHMLHLLTAGKERVLGRKFTDAEILAYQSEAAAYQKRLVNAYQRYLIAKVA